MKILKKIIFKIENVARISNVLDIPSTNSIILSYVVSDYYKYQDNFINANKTLIINEATNEQSYLMDGLRILEISSAGNLYALYDEIQNRDACIVSYDLSKKEYIKINYKSRLSFGFGSSKISEKEINKLFVTFWGQDVRGLEGILILSTKNNQIKVIDLNGHPSRMEIFSNRLFAIVAGFNGRNKLMILDAETDTIFDTIDLDIIPINIIRKDEYLLLLELSKGIHFFDTRQKKIVEFRSIPEIHAIQPINNNRFFALFLARRKPSYRVDRLALYDIDKDKIVDKINLFDGLFLKTMNGRTICVEREKKGTSAIISEIKIVK